MKYLTNLLIVVIFILSMSTISYSQFSDTVTVGEGGNFQTLNEFIDSLNVFGLSDNTTVNIISDLELENPIIINQWYEYGLGGNYFLTIKPSGGVRTIQGNFSANGIIEMNNVHRVIIDGGTDDGERNFIIKNNAITGANCAIRLIGTDGEGCSDITIKNCEISGENRLNTNSFGIYLGSATITSNTAGAGYDIDNVLIENNWIKNSYNGIRAFANSNSTYENLIINNNEIGSDNLEESVGIIGINLNYCPNSIIKNNFIHNINWSGSPNAISGIQLNNSNNSEISNNKINSLWQIYYNFPGGGAYGINAMSSSLLIANNEIFDIVTTTNSPTIAIVNISIGIRITGSNQRIYFNSINLYGIQQQGMMSNGNISACILATSNLITGLDIRNNVLSNNLEGLSGSIQACIYFPSNNAQNAFSIIDYNDYYVGEVAGRVGYIEGSWHYTLADWKNATLKDTSSISVNPMFTSNDNLLPLINSPLLCAGINIEEILFDKLEIARLNPPTIGAYEIDLGDDLPPPLLLLPVKNAFSVSLLTDFSWQIVEGAEYYNIQVATDDLFQNIVIDSLVLSNNFFLNYYLLESTYYYWRVKGVADGLNAYWSQVWKFTTEGTVSPVTLSTPVNESIGVVLFPTFTWEEVFGATYNIEIYDDNTIVALGENIIIPSWTLTEIPLETNKQYYWQVRANISGNTSEWSERWAFKTMTQVNTSTYFFVESSEQYIEFEDGIQTGLSGDNEGLNIELPFSFTYGSIEFNEIRICTNGWLRCGGGDLANYNNLLYATAINQLIAPLWDDLNVIDGYGNISYKTIGEVPDRAFIVQFKSISRTSNPNENVNFQVKLDERTSSISFIYGTMEISSTSWNASIGLNGLMGGINDFISVTPGTDNNPATVSSTSSYDYIYLWNTELSNKKYMFIPDKHYVNLQAPENNSYSINITPLFSWDTLQSYNYYSLQVSNTSDFNNLVVDESDIYGNSFLLEEALDASTLYYWRVKAHDENGYDSYWSYTWKFLTEGPYPAVELIAPQNNNDCVSIIPVFSWERLFDFEFYEIQIAQDIDFNNIIIYNSDLSNNYWELPIENALENNTTYYWRVHSYTEDNSGEWSDIWTFTTSYMVNEFSYNFINENEEYTELTDGIQTGIYGDNVANNFELPFPFLYGNQIFDSIRICSNGWIKFGTDTSTTSFNEIESLTNIQLLAPLWDDLKIEQGVSSITIKTEGEAPMRSFIIQYKNVMPVYGNDTVNFQVVLYENNGNIAFKYGNTDFSSLEYWWEASIGINGSVGGILDFINVLGIDDENTYVSSYEYNNWLDYSQIEYLENKKIVFSPIKYFVLLNSPEDNQKELGLEPTLYWHELEGSSAYNLQVSTDKNFSNLIIDLSGINNTFYEAQLSDLLVENTTYFWRVQAIDSLGNASFWSQIWNFTTYFIPWNIVSNTGNSATLIVPFSANPMIGDRVMENGDMIGLFYQNDENEWQCAGYGIWNGQNLGITVWGDNDTTETKDGFTVGETYTYKVWDAVLGQEWNATATYQIGESYYTVNGLSFLASLIVNIPAEQNISLSSGWNIISSYIEPENDTITTVFVNVVTNVKIVKNGAGEMYNPAFNINTIGNWNNEDGYLVNMLSDNELTISGQKLVPETTPINLNNGWNLSAYLRDNQMSPTTALASITSSLVLAKDNAGGIFSPVYGINTLGNMQSGQGYYFYMNAAAELTYPANSTQKAVAGDEITPLAKYNIPTIGNTGKNATLLISIENNDGNEIGVYNMNNELIGAGAVHNGVAAITIWGDDEATQNVDGAKDNEYLNVKLYNTNNNTSKEISLSQIKEITSDTEQSELYYKTNAIYVAKASAHNESGFAMSIKNIPNPVENDVVFEFGLTQEANAEIQIYTSTGELVAKIGNGNYTAGLHRINFDASNLANGMYNIVLSSGSKKVSSFMIVGK